MSRLNANQQDIEVRCGGSGNKQENSRNDRDQTPPSNEQHEARDGRNDYRKLADEKDIINLSANCAGKSDLISKRTLCIRK